MRLPMIERLIDLADFITFREIVTTYLRQRGYRDAPNTDGWRDGGSDVSLYLVPQSKLPIAVQLTTERKWESKLRLDASKVKKNYKSITNLTFISSHRIPEREFERVADEVYGRHGLTVRKVDNQSIATEYFSNGLTAELLQMCGIDVSASIAAAGPKPLRERAAYSYLLFSDPSREFRSQVLDTVVCLGAHEPQGVRREQLVERVATELQYQVGQEAMVESAIDRQLQRGNLVSSDGRIRVSKERADALRDAETLQDAEWRLLRERIRELLVRLGAAGPAAVSLSAFLVDRAGVLCMASATGLVSSIAERRGTQTVQDIRGKMREIDSALDEFGFDPGSSRPAVLEAISEEVFRSPIASHMIAGEVFLALSRMSGSNLVSALGSGENLVVLLDASVAIPILTCMNFEPAGQRYFRASWEMFNQLVRHGVTVRLPLDYAEESATHLIEAHQLYGELVELEDDLRFSRNAYVAHYVSLKVAQKFDGNFLDYLEGLGIPRRDLSGDFRIVRSLVQRRIEKAMRQIGIEVVALGNASTTSWRLAEEAVSYALRELRQERSRGLIDHDTRTIAALFELDLGVADTTVFITWDRVHQYVYEHEQSVDWHVMSPATMADLLAVVRSPDGAEPTLSAWMIAMAMLDEAAALGASVWDNLVHLEKDLAHDAKLRSEAQEFKNSFLRDRQRFTRDELAREWEAWRAMWSDSLN